MERLLVPGIRTHDQRSHGPDGAFDTGRIGGARTLAPAHEAIVGGQLYDDVGYAAAIDQRTRLDALVGDAREEGFYFGNFHFSDPALSRYVEPRFHGANGDRKRKAHD